MMTFGPMSQSSGTIAVEFDDRGGRAASEDLGRRIKGLGGERVGPVWLLADEEGHAGGRPLGGLFIDKGGAGTRAHECFDVPPVFEKADVFRSRDLKRGHIAEQPTAVLGAQQSRPTQGAQRIQSKWAGAVKKASVRHLGSVRASSAPYFFFGLAGVLAAGCAAVAAGTGAAGGGVGTAKSTVNVGINSSSFCSTSSVTSKLWSKSTKSAL